MQICPNRALHINAKTQILWVSLEVEKAGLTDDDNSIFKHHFKVLVSQFLRTKRFLKIVSWLKEIIFWFKLPSFVAWSAREAVFNLPQSQLWWGEGRSTLIRDRCGQALGGYTPRLTS